MFAFSKSLLYLGFLSCVFIVPLAFVLVLCTAIPPSSFLSRECAGNSLVACQSDLVRSPISVATIEKRRSISDITDIDVNMAQLPLLPRCTFHLLTAFTIVAFVLIILFPTLGYTKSVYRPLDDSPTIITDAFADPTVSPSIYLKLQQPPDGFNYDGPVSERVRQTIDSPRPWISALKVIGSSLRVAGTGIVIAGHFLWIVMRPLQVVIIFLFDKLVFVFQPFIIMGTGIYTLAFLWPIQLVNYLAKTFYPIYLFLACASIVGLVVGSIASYTSSYINGRLFPRPPPKSILPAIESRPKTAESSPESMYSSGTATPAPYRVPPPSKYSSGGIDDVHILDTNALFSSFSLPIPPPTPPGILYTAPTPAGSVSGVVGETIFEEDDDSDDKTPVASVASWALGAGKPLTRPESAHGRITGKQEGIGAGGTWHPKIKREEVDVQGISFGDDEIRKRK